MSSPSAAASFFPQACSPHRPAHPVARRSVLLSILLALLAPDAHAWGPHPRITDAALETLGPTNALAQALGPQLPLRVGAMRRRWSNYRNVPAPRGAAG